MRSNFAKVAIATFAKDKGLFTNLKLYLQSITNKVQRIIGKDRVEKREIVKYKMLCL